MLTLLLYLRLNSLWLRRGGGKQKKTKTHGYNLRLSVPHRKVRRKQKGFLSRYDTAYTGRDTVNQAAQYVNKLAPELRKQADGILEKRIEDLMLRAGTLEPKLIKGAIEDLYKTPFQLLGCFGRKKYEQLKSKVMNKLLRVK